MLLYRAFGLGLGLGVYRQARSGGAPPYIPALKFNDPRNSMYVGVISAFVA